MATYLLFMDTVKLDDGHADFAGAYDAWVEAQSTNPEQHVKVIHITEFMGLRDLTARCICKRLSFVRTHRGQDMNEAPFWLLDAMDREAARV